MPQNHNKHKRTEYTRYSAKRYVIPSQIAICGLSKLDSMKKWFYVHIIFVICLKTFKYVQTLFVPPPKYDMLRNRENKLYHADSFMNTKTFFMNLSQENL